MNTISRRSFLLATASGVAGLGLVACGGSNQAATTSAATTAAAGSDPTTASAGSEFVVGFDQAYPPYGYVDDKGEFAGFDLDLAQAVCADQGWTYKAEPIDWDAKDTLINSGAITCIWNGFTIEGREESYTFTEPYMLNAQVVVVKADSAVKALADLAGKTVVTQVDSAAYEVLGDSQAQLAATFKALETRAEYNTAFMELESGAVDAVACDLSIAKYQEAAKQGAYVVLADYLSEEHYGVGFKRGQTAMADAVTASLKKLDAAGKVKELCDKYADQGISYDNWCLK